MSKKTKNKSKRGIEKVKSESFWKKNTDLPLIVVTILLLIIGLITLLSASSSRGLSDATDSYYYVKRQVIAVVVGIVGAGIFMMIDYRKFNNKAILFLILMGILGLIFLVKITGIGEGGATRWIIIGGFNFQPSEFIKLGMIIFTAGLLTKIIKEGSISSLSKGFLLPIVITGVIAILIYKWQNHLSAAVVVAGITFAQMFIAGTKLIYLLSTLGVGIAGIVYFIANISANTESFRVARILAWKNPEAYSQGYGWQILQSLYAIGSGGMIGLGIGQSRQKQEFLPEPQNDFIASIYAEETGFIGSMFLLVIFVILLHRAVTIAHNTKDVFGKILATGITALFAIEIIFNFLVITNLVPVTGIGLPFFSYGGTAMVVNLIAVGILLSIHRISNRKE